MLVDLSQLIARIDAEIVEAETAARTAELRLAELRGQRAGVLLAVAHAQQVARPPEITEGTDDRA